MQAGRLVPGWRKVLTSQLGKTTSNVRETGASRHAGGKLRASLKPLGMILLCDVRGVSSGVLNWAPMIEAQVYRKAVPLVVALPVRLTRNKAPFMMSKSLLFALPMHTNNILSNAYKYMLCITVSNAYK